MHEKKFTSVYWRDPDGSSPPSDAEFGFFPFFSEAQFQNFGSLKRIHSLPKLTKPYKTQKKRVTPSKDLFVDWIEKAKDAFEKKELRKVILARKCKLICKEKIDPLKVIQKLEEKNLHATLFCFFNEKEAFLGASPEIIFRKKQNKIETEALASTLKRGRTNDEDAALENELLGSGKMQKEFAHVERFIEEELKSLRPTSLLSSPLYVKKTPNVQHLCKRFEAQITEEISPLDLLRKLHPTPAIGGFPKKEAVQFVKDHENFDRRFYGGAFGYFNDSESNFIASIRCCYIKENEVEIFTGAGIISDSDPELEWIELDHKMNLFKDIFQWQQS